MQDKTQQNSIEIDSLTGTISVNAMTTINLQAPRINFDASAMIQLSAPAIMNQAVGTITSQAQAIISQGAGTISCIAGGPLILKGTPPIIG
jgi:hypothetical protein